MQPHHPPRQVIREHDVPVVQPASARASRPTFATRPDRCPPACTASRPPADAGARPAPRTPYPCRLGPARDPAGICRPGAVYRARSMSSVPSSEQARRELSKQRPHCGHSCNQAVPKPSTRLRICSFVRCCRITRSCTTSCRNSPPSGAPGLAEGCDPPRVRLFRLFSCPTTEPYPGNHLPIQRTTSRRRSSVQPTPRHKGSTVCWEGFDTSRLIGIGHSTGSADPSGICSPSAR